MQINHEYYYQIPTQLLLCGVKYGDFVIWSPYEECYVERIQVNDEICSEIMVKAKWFFCEAILSELLGRYITNNEQSLENIIMSEREE